MIHYEHIPENFLSVIDNARKVLENDSNIVFAYLFGGLAKGTQKPLSDIDVAVYINSTKDIAIYKMKLFDTLADILRTSEIDLVILNDAPESISGRILQNKKILVDKEPFRRHEYESMTLRKFFDFSIKEKQILYRRYGIDRHTTSSS